MVVIPAQTNFRENLDVVSAIANRSPENFFDLAEIVERRCIDGGRPGVDCGVKDANALRITLLSAAHRAEYDS